MNRRRTVEGKIYNISKGLILPMVGINYRILPHCFLESYITDNYEVIIVFDKTLGYNEAMYRWINSSANNVYLNSCNEDEDEVVLIFKIPEVYYRDFDLFKIGKYSKFSNNYKEVIKRFFGVKSIMKTYEVTIYDMLQSQLFKRQQIADRLGVDVKLIEEVYDAPNMNQEIFKPLDELLKVNEGKESKEKEK